MAVTIQSSSYGANAISALGAFASSTKEVLQKTCPPGEQGPGRLLQSSMNERDLPSHFLASKNGLVHSIIRAYSDHHHLILRPEDIWFAIVGQFSRYVNHHAEELRQHFVSHADKKELAIGYDYPAGRSSFDFRVFAKDMNQLLQEHVVDPELREWILPAFTTTTDQDTVVGSILFMGAMQKYFDYTCILLCGIPTVTLLGERKDYEKILQKVDRLGKYGDQPAQFGELLKPVVRRFISSFDQPTSQDTVDFWQRVLDVNNNGSGVTFHSGWITAFCFWKEDGQCLYDPTSHGDSNEDDWRQEVFGDVVTHENGYNLRRHITLNLQLDGTKYHKVGC